MEVAVAFEKRPKEAVIAPTAVIGRDQHQVRMGVEHVVQKLPPLLDVHEERNASIHQFAQNRPHRHLVEQIAMSVRTCPQCRNSMIPHSLEQIVHSHFGLRRQDVPDRQQALAALAECRYLLVRFERVGEVSTIVVHERTVYATVVHLLQQGGRDEGRFERRKQTHARVGIAVEELDALAGRHAASPVTREAAARLIRWMIRATSRSVLSGWVSTHTVLPRMSIDCRHISFE